MTQGVPEAHPFLMDQNEDRDLGAVCSLLVEMIESLRGFRPDEPRQVESQALLEKILQHAVTIRLLHNRPISLRSGQGTVAVYDFPSGLVLCRAVIETYLTLHDVFLAPRSEDEFDFAYNLWRIRGIINLQNFDPITLEGNARHQGFLSDLGTYRARVESTTYYKNLNERRQKAALAKGEDLSKPHRDFAAAGFSSVAFQRLYGYASGYVHSDGHAAFQIRSAKHKPDDQRSMFGMALVLATMAISKIVLELEGNYEQCKAVGAGFPEVMGLARKYSWAAVHFGDPELRDEGRRIARGESGSPMPAGE